MRKASDQTQLHQRAAAQRKYSNLKTFLQQIKFSNIWYGGRAPFTVYVNRFIVAI